MTYQVILPSVPLGVVCLICPFVRVSRLENFPKVNKIELTYGQKLPLSEAVTASEHNFPSGE
jgi:hypothetical protein